MRDFNILKYIKNIFIPEIYYKIIIDYDYFMTGEFKSLNKRTTCKSICFIHILNDERIVLGLDDGYINFWNSECVLKGHTNFITYIDELSNNRLITISFDHTMKVWDLNSFTNIITLEMNIIKISRFYDDKFVIESDVLSIWDMNKYNHEFTFQDENCFAVLPNNKLVTGSKDNSLRIWNEGKCITILGGHERVINYLTALPNNQILSASDSDMKIWNMNRECITTLINKSKYIYTVICLNRQLGFLYYNNRDMSIWNLETKKEEFILQNHGKTKHILVLPDGRIATGFSRTLKIWNPETGECDITYNVRGVIGSVKIFKGKLLVGLMNGILLLCE